jgi:hypothetical protein
MLSWPLTVLGLLGGLGLGTLPARCGLGQGVEYVKAQYTKYEFRIPMRDGTRLFTAVYVPKDESVRYPMLLIRTPYSVGPYGADQYRGDLGPSALFGKSGYIFVYQDVRGRYMSEGQFVDVRPVLPRTGPHRITNPSPPAPLPQGERGVALVPLKAPAILPKGERGVALGPLKGGRDSIDESSDTWDTIQWLTQHIANHNGKVGMWGISYPGYYAAAGMLDAHPALKAVSPQAPISDWFVGDDWHHNGALMLNHAFNFMADFGHPRPQPTKKPVAVRFDHGTPDGYQFFLNMGPLGNANAKYFKNDVPFWNEVMAHGSYDAFWKARDLRPHLRDVRPAVMTVGGWFDAEDLFGALETYKRIAVQSPQTRQFLVMGPWVHGGWSRGEGESLGAVSFNAKTSAYFRENIELPFFEYHLKGKPAFSPPGAWVFQTGTNQWRRYSAWPPREARPRTLYLRGAGRLAFEPPGRDEPSAYDEYVSDPARPVPFHNPIDAKMAPDYMVEDQRFAGRRPDVLVYQTGVLEEDLSVAGPIGAELQVATSGTDSDWIVKVIDVYPDDYPDPNPSPGGARLGGYEQLVRGEVMRGKFRNSYERPEPFVPGRPAAVRLALPDVCHTFRSGHRLMVQVQSTWFPLIDRNPQTFCDIYSAQESDFHKSTQRVYHAGEHASRLVLPTL